MMCKPLAQVLVVVVFFTAHGIQLDDYYDASAQINATTSHNHSGCEKTVGTCYVWPCDASKDSGCSWGKCKCNGDSCKAPNGACWTPAQFHQHYDRGKVGYNECGNEFKPADERTEMALLAGAVYKAPCTQKYSNPAAGWAVERKWEEYLLPRFMSLFGLQGVDAVGLYKKDTRCAVVFAGSDDLYDWASNVFLIYKNVPDLGLQRVHSGFHGEMMDFLESADYKTKFVPILKDPTKCKQIYAVGHSLGGAQASIFAAAINHVEYKRTVEHKTDQSWAEKPNELPLTGFKVDKLYTIGAPPPSADQLTNSYASDGFFNGSRAFNTEYSRTQDAVPWLQQFFNWNHPRVNAIELKENSAVNRHNTAPEKSPCLSCNTHSTGLDDTKRLHYPSVYVDRLRAAQGI